MSLRSLSCALTCSAALFATTSVAMADGEEPHRDVWISLDADGRILIGSVTEGDGGKEIFESNVRVFEAELGEDPAFPFSGDEPGFELEDGDSAPNTPFTFLIDGPVTKWNGDGYEATTATMFMSFGPLNVTSGGNWAPGFVFNSDSAGGFHNHFELTLLGDQGADPELGIYLVPMRMAVAGTDSSSDTFYWVMNLGLDEEAHEAAAEWVEDNIIAEPCPADVDRNGTVDFADVLGVLSAWGQCL